MQVISLTLQLQPSPAVCPPTPISLSPPLIYVCAVLAQQHHVRVLYNSVEGQWIPLGVNRSRVADVPSDLVTAAGVQAQHQRLHTRG